MTAPNAAPMGAEEVLAVMKDDASSASLHRADAHGLARATDALHRSWAAHDAVAAMAEREAAQAAELDDFKKELGRFTDIACRYKAERDALVKEVEALREDAERYRWLRENAKPDDLWYEEVVLRLSTPDIDGFDSLDEIIDAARTEASKP